MHAGIGYQGPGRYQVEFTDGMLGEVNLPSERAFLGAIHRGVEVYVHGNTDGNLGFSIKKALKKVRKVVKKVAAPVTKLTQKVTELPGLKQVKGVVRKVAAGAAGLTPAGLVLQPKAFGIKSRSSQKLFTTTQRISRVAVAPAAALMIKGITSAVPRGVVTEAPAILPSEPGMAPAPWAPTMFVPEQGMPMPQGPMAIPGWESAGGGGGGGGIMPTPETPTPEEAPPGAEEKKPGGGAALLLGLIGVGLYAMSGGK